MHIIIYMKLYDSSGDPSFFMQKVKRLSVRFLGEEKVSYRRMNVYSIQL